jgi:hypothetical protein
MSVTVTISDQELAAIRQLTKVDDDAEAIVQAARQFLRSAQLRELKLASGRVDYDANSYELAEELELSELSLPQ